MKIQSKKVIVEIRDQIIYSCIVFFLSQYSMKSDSGGEMESCRSSDSELQDSNSGSSSPANLLMLGENLAEKETELIKVKLECRRLQEDNISMNQQLRIKKDKRILDLEKEVDHLKWQLNAVIPTTTQFVTSLHHYYFLFTDGDESSNL